MLTTISSLSDSTVMTPRITMKKDLGLGLVFQSPKTWSKTSKAA